MRQSLDNKEVDMKRPTKITSIRATGLPLAEDQLAAAVGGLMTSDSAHKGNIDALGGAPDPGQLPLSWIGTAYPI
jgi:hypothetical protein